MLFNSFEYLLFYAVFFALFFCLKRIEQQIYLIIAGSLFFYGAWSAWHVLLLLFVCAVAYAAQVLGKSRKVTTLVVSTLLGTLFVFKYYNFFAGQTAALNLDMGASELLLPVGISFYVFQAISFVMDSRRNNTETATLPQVVAYIAFFPQLAVGPIIRASVFLPQLLKAKKFNKYMFYSGMLLFSMGMFKKLVIADNLGVFIDAVYLGTVTTTAANHILVFYLYAIQIYYDFCGYSEMAIGIARTLGFKFPRNFNRPYLSASITEFWRRWHISLSSWFRDYLYISLGGNRKGKLRTCFNLAAVMLLGGLWHGAAWNFIIWGAIHGALLAVERLFNYAPKRTWSRVLGIVLTLHLVCVSWVFFRAPDFATAIGFFSAMLDPSTLTTITTKFTAFKCLALIPLFVLIEYFSRSQTFLMLRNQARLVIIASLASILFLLLGNFSNTPFIYFQF